MMPSNSPKEKFFKYRVPRLPDVDLTAFCDHLAAKLEVLEYEVKVQRVDFVVMRVRRTSNQWTQGYVKAHERWIDFVGPEAMEIGEFLINGVIP